MSLLWRCEPEVRVPEPREPWWCKEADEGEEVDEEEDEGCDDDEEVDEGCDDEEVDEGCDEVLAPSLEDLNPSRGSIPANSEAD
ncbi:hypothetical protein MCAP1_002400 [Malassezia caprae]|uniref:Uncharacterized protein n=1 Tax=Malassezia caprae TaxID=1381934 RepID=A0AAF0E8A8_9BASI|nr:hypothetical protein MCAP1_002400 [Malassezia caprae]